MEIPASGFQSVILCSNLKMMHAKRGYHALTQRITIVKIFMEYKKVLLLLNLPQIQEAQCEMLWSLRSFLKKQVKHNWTYANLWYLSSHKKSISSHTSFIRYYTFKNSTIWQFDWQKFLASTHPSKIGKLLTTLMKVNISSSRWPIYSTWLELNKLAKFLRCELSEKYILILSWWRSLSYRNQSSDFQSKSMDWFLYDKDLPHESVIVLEQLSNGVLSCAAVSVDA